MKRNGKTPHFKGNAKSASFSGKILFLSAASLCALTAPELYAGNNELNSQVMQTSQSIKSITGKIYDENNEAMIGVSVTVKGTTTGTVTDIDGNFNLNVPSGSSIIEVSYIGYVKQSLNVAGKNNLSIRLVPDTKNLDEVVVVGYGTVKKRDLTGSVVSVKSDQITIAPTNNVMEALQGRVSGMDIMKPSGQIGSDVEIQLRGSRTIYGSNEDRKSVV